MDERIEGKPAPRVDLARVRMGPTAADLADIPATTQSDWDGADHLIPIDPDMWRDFLAFRAARRG
ncbi:MAG: hypothetical protein RLY86_2356 [Pseudomonadota bacterium]|jgi:hypothetical protein